MITDELDAELYFSQNYFYEVCAELRAPRRRGYLIFHYNARYEQNLPAPDRPEMRKPLNPDALHASYGTFLAVEAALEAGIADKHSVFELSTQELPRGLNYGVVAGTNRAVQQLQTYLLDDSSLDYLATFLKQETVEYLSELRFRGSVMGLKEGDLYLAHTPILTVECTYALGLLIHKMLTSIFNFESAIATAAHLIRAANRGRLLYTVGLDALDWQSAEAFSRACHLVGFEASDELGALRSNADMNAFGGLPENFYAAFAKPAQALEALQGTLDDQLTLALHQSELSELKDEISRALMVFGEQLFAISLNNPEQVRHAKALRKHLDKLNAPTTNIIYLGTAASAGKQQMILDMPVDSIGMTPEMIYNSLPRSSNFSFDLVALQDEMYGEFRRIPADSRLGGRKVIYREHGEDWKLAAEYLITDPAQQILSHWSRPAVIYVKNGKLIFLPSLEQVRETAADILTTAPDATAETHWLPDIEADTKDEPEATED